MRRPEETMDKRLGSYPRSPGSIRFEKRYETGEIDLEVVPQGTLAERIRAAGGGDRRLPDAHGLRHAPGRGQGDRRWLLVRGSGVELCRRAAGLRTAHRPEPGHPVPDCAVLRQCRGGQAPGGGCFLEGGECLHPDLRRLRLRPGRRRGAEIPRNAALPGGAGLHEPHPVPCCRARSRHAEEFPSR